VRRIKIWTVQSLEVGCRVTRFVEWVPGWKRVYHCNLARLSNQLDARWHTGQWHTHGSGLEGWDEWDAWFSSQSDERLATGHWHAWK
jgi:hypothetical protein